MKRTSFLLFIVAVMLVLPAVADAADRSWHIRVFAAGIDPDLNEIYTNDDGDSILIQADSDLGFGASLGYQFSRVVGIELGAFTGNPDVKLSAEIPGLANISFADGLSTRVVTLDLDLHLTPNSPWFDFYVGGGVASVGFGDLHYDDPIIEPLDTIPDDDLIIDPLHIIVDDDFTWSAKVGLDIALGRNSAWAAFGVLRYIDAEIEVTQVDDPDQTKVSFDYNVVNFSVGVAYRF